MDSKTSRGFVAVGVIAPTATAIVVVALVLAGCSGGSAPAARSGTPAAVGSVTANGAGKAAAAPDRADLTFNVSARAKTSKDAMDAAGKASAKLVDAFKATGVAAEDIQTQNVSLSPERDRRNAITGYAAYVSLAVTTRDLAKAGDLLDAGTKAGATDVWGPSLYLSETNEARTRAIDAAIADAKVRAERMAKAAGRQLGAVVSITEKTAESYPYASRYAATAYKSLSVAPAIQPGQMDAYASVSVKFELR